MAMVTTVMDLFRLPIHAEEYHLINVATNQNVEWIHSDLNLEIGEHFPDSFAFEYLLMDLSPN